MAPVARDLRAVLLDHIRSNDVMIFSKTTCPFCDKVCIIIYLLTYILILILITFYIS